MNERIKQLRRESLEAVNRISPERAQLLTEFYKNHRLEETSMPMLRAQAFRFLLENKTICINPGELIVGERGPAPKAVPTYPEICIHSLEDLDIISSREKIPFGFH